MKSIIVDVKRYTMHGREVTNFDKWKSPISMDEVDIATLIYNLYLSQNMDRRGWKYQYKYTIHL